MIAKMEDLKLHIYVNRTKSKTLNRTQNRIQETELIAELIELSERARRILLNGGTIEINVEWKIKTLSQLTNLESKC